MSFKIDNLEINLNGVTKALILIGVGVCVGRATKKTRERTVHVVLEDRRKERKTTKKVSKKVESK